MYCSTSFARNLIRFRCSVLVITGFGEISLLRIFRYSVLMCMGLEVVEEAGSLDRGEPFFKPGVIQFDVSVRFGRGMQVFAGRQHSLFIALPKPI